MYLSLRLELFNGLTTDSSSSIDFNIQSNWDFYINKDIDPTMKSLIINIAFSTFKGPRSHQMS